MHDKCFNDDMVPIIFFMTSQYGAVLNDDLIYKNFRFVMLFFRISRIGQPDYDATDRSVSPQNYDEMNGRHAPAAPTANGWGKPHEVPET